MGRVEGRPARGRGRVPVCRAAHAKATGQIQQSADPFRIPSDQAEVWEALQGIALNLLEWEVDVVNCALSVSVVLLHRTHSKDAQKSATTRFG
jgi:hypothetical protein